MLKNKNSVFACFSPPVMIATLFIEMILFVATLFIYKQTRVVQLIAALLFFLGFFQLAEYFVCGGLGVNGEMWSRLGFMAITTLPPVGLHLIYAIAKRKIGLLQLASYTCMLLWIIFFGFAQSAFASHECVSNYVIFKMVEQSGYFYGVYYYGILFLGILNAFRFSKIVKKRPVKQSLYAMIVGYLVFLLPTAVVNTINPATMAGIPSIMCGFAVLFALILYFYILPRMGQRR